LKDNNAGKYEMNLKLILIWRAVLSLCAAPGSTGTGFVQNCLTNGHTCRNFS